MRVWRPLSWVFLKEKKAKKTKSSEVRRLQRQIESGEGSASRAVEEAMDVLRVEFQTRWAKILDFLGSLECIRSRDLALATIDDGMAVVKALQGETPSSLQAEEARLSACKGDLAAVDGSFDFVLADLKSECFLQTCSEEPKGQDPVVRENRGGAAPSLDEAMGEGEYLLRPCMAVFMFWDWPLVALNPGCIAAFYEWIFSLRLWQDLGLLLVLAGTMTNSTYASHYSFDLIPYRFKVHNRFSAYMTCLRYYPCVGCMRVIFARWLSLFRTLGVDEATEGRRLRKRKEKIPKNLKREANEKELNGFTKRVLRIPVEIPFDEVYYTHRLWMFFRETKETEEDIRRMFHHVRKMMKLRITLKKKSDPGKFAVPCVVKAFRSLKEISSELTIRGRYEEEAIVRCTSSAVDRYRREASTIEDYDRSMYILYHRSMSRREMRDLVPADFKPKASPNYKITPDEFLT
ncbi:hypothetical protein F2Q69_00007536 [Brassica cretica]|uniref:Uncharacterized protein n=1 Tax=Brassica cretica TaxID=69181 RepID=A0A8S9PF10_BRACR|nr:hypothetical protein F2Q69_00007536 [Brassica cretica]